MINKVHRVKRNKKQYMYIAVINGEEYDVKGLMGKIGLSERAAGRRLQAACDGEIDVLDVLKPKQINPPPKRKRIYIRATADMLDDVERLAFCEKWGM